MLSQIWIAKVPRGEVRLIRNDVGSRGYAVIGLAGRGRAWRVGVRQGEADVD